MKNITKRSKAHAATKKHREAIDAYLRKYGGTGSMPRCLPQSNTARKRNTI